MANRKKQDIQAIISDFISFHHLHLCSLNFWDFYTLLAKRIKKKKVGQQRSILYQLQKKTWRRAWNCKHRSDLSANLSTKQCWGYRVPQIIPFHCFSSFPLNSAWIHTFCPCLQCHKWARPTLVFPDAPCILATLLPRLQVSPCTVLLPGIIFPYSVTCLRPITLLALSVNVTSEAFLETLNNMYITLVPSHALLLSEYTSPSFIGLIEFIVTWCVYYNVCFTGL